VLINQDDGSSFTSAVALTSPSTSSARSGPRHAYCPLCGDEQSEKLVSEIRNVEDALCRGRCSAAWRVLEGLRLRESASRQIALRRRLESEAGQPHMSVLSEVLLHRWRAGDWTITPEGLAALIRLPLDATVHEGDRGTCASCDE
jgi:hypothetical protein